MYKIIIKYCITSLLVFYSVFLQAQSGKWEVIEDLDGNFRIICPGKMESNTREVETELGPLEYITFFYQPPEELRENEMYMLSYCDYPKGTIHSDSLNLIEDFFNATIESAVLAVDGELIYQSERPWRDYPGYIWRIAYFDGQVYVKTHAFLVNNRYYALQTVTRQALSLNQAADRFLDSFLLLNEE